MKCTHDRIKDEEGDYGFTRPVYVEPFTSENRAAHGGIDATETCRACGSQRDVLMNGGQYEYSPWGPDLATRNERLREKWYRERDQRRSEIQKFADAASSWLKKQNFKVVQFGEGNGGQVLVRKPDFSTHWLTIDDAWEAAQLADDEHDQGLQSLYSAIAAVGETLRPPEQPPRGDPAFPAY